MRSVITVLKLNVFKLSVTIHTTSFGNINLYSVLHFILFRKNHMQKAQVGNDQEMAQSERKSHTKNRGGKK